MRKMYIPFIGETDILNWIGAWLDSFLPNIGDLLVAIVELIFYPIIFMISHIYQLIDNLYTNGMLVVNFIINLDTYMMMFISNYWPHGAPSGMTYLLILSIGVANSYRVMKAIGLIYRKIPLLGGK